MAAAEDTGLPLRGVVHSAAVIDDNLVATLSTESLERVWAPKAGGALRLHESTSGRQLDWWVGFSSVASLLGSPGQGAYACAKRGSTPWSRGEERRVCPLPRSIGASGRTWESPAR